MTEGYFAAEEAIASRIAENVPELKSAVGYRQPRHWSAAQRRPFVAVILEEPEPAGRNGNRTLIKQRWRITLVVDMINEHSGANARAEAGPILTKIISALAGWTPGQDMAPMQPSSGYVGVYENDCASFSLVFTTGLII